MTKTTAGAKVRKILEERPWYCRDRKASKFVGFDENWQGTSADLVVFTDGATRWPGKVLAREGQFCEECPEEYEPCESCDAFADPGMRWSDYTDGLVFCSRSCLREYMDRETEPDRGRGAVTKCGSVLY